MKKQMKKMIILTLTAGLGLFSACGVNENTKESIDVTEANTESGIDIDDLLHSLKWANENEVIELFKKEYLPGYEFTIGEGFDSLDAELPEKGDDDIRQCRWMVSEHEGTEYLLQEYYYQSIQYKIIYSRNKEKYIAIEEFYVNQVKQKDAVIKDWCDDLSVKVLKMHVQDESSSVLSADDISPDLADEIPGNSVDGVYTATLESGSEITLEIWGYAETGFYFKFSSAYDQGQYPEGYAVFDGEIAYYYDEWGDGINLWPVDSIIEVNGGVKHGSLQGTYLK